MGHKMQWHTMGLPKTALQVGRTFLKPVMQSEETNFFMQSKLLLAK